MEIRASSLTRVFREGGGETVRALDGVDLDFRSGEIVILLGPSGSGKTTLLNLLSGLDTPSEGRVTFGGHDLSRLGDREKSLLRNRSVGFIFQFFNLLPEFTVLENALIPAMVGRRHFAVFETRQAVRKIMDDLGMGGRLEAMPSELSGGEQQRVAIGRALVNNPDFVFADEPTGNLDAENTRICLDVFRRRNRESGTAFMIATHDEEIADWPGARVLRLRDGRLLD